MANAICLLSDMCRLCLDEPGVNNIYENDALIQDIIVYTGILHISIADKHLPSSICSSCLYRIEVAKDLKNFSAKNDLYMKSLLNEECQSAHQIARQELPKKPITPLTGLMTASTVIATSNNKTKENHKSTRTQKDSPSKTSPESSSPKVKQAKISVRSLADINMSLYPADTSKKDDSPSTSKINKSSLSEDTKTANVMENTCDSSSEQHKKSLKRSRSNSTKELTGNDEHTCDICEKSYATAKKLYFHRRTHSKSLYCPLDACGKSFVTKGDLQKHIRSHTGEKPYHCDLCDKSFTQNVSLKAHKEAVHVEKHN